MRTWSLLLAPTCDLTLLLGRQPESEVLVQVHGNGPVLDDEILADPEVQDAIKNEGSVHRKLQDPQHRPRHLWPRGRGRGQAARRQRLCRHPVLRPGGGPC